MWAWSCRTKLFHAPNRRLCNQMTEGRRRMTEDRRRMTEGYFLCPLFFVFCSLVIAQSRTTPNQNELKEFIQAHVENVEPLSTKANLVYWEAATTGKSEKFKELEQLQLRIRRICSDPNDFNRLKVFKAGGQIKDPRLARQLDKLYLAYLQNQIEPEL